VILGIDCGTATFGWAVVDAGLSRVVALGAMVQGVDAEVAKSTDSSRRVANQTDQLGMQRYISTKSPWQVVHEAGSYNPRQFKMSVGLAMSIGAVVGFAVCNGIPLYELPPKRWQQAITGRPGKVDYDDVYRRVEQHVARWQPAMDQLGAIKPRHRNHALDAAGIALCHAIDPTLATLVR